MGIRKLVKQVLTEKENKRYAKQLATRRISYDSWIRGREREHIYRNVQSTSAAEIFAMPWGRLSEHARELIEHYFAEHPEVQLLYGDEDVWEAPRAGAVSSQRSNPWFKPQWSPDLFDSWYYFGSVVAVRKELLEKYPCPQGNDKFVSWVRTCAEAVGGWQRGCKAIGHIPGILFHCDGEENLKKYMQWKTKECVSGSNLADACTQNNSQNPVVDDSASYSLSIIIPSKDNPEILKKCLQAIPGAAGLLPYEIIVVDNGSNEINRHCIEAMLQDYEKKNAVDSGKVCTVKYIYQPMEFHFSKMCNLGAEKAEGNLLLFLNDDVELCQENCLCRLAELAAREYVGAAGVKLLYPNLTKIQHTGITNLPMGPVHKLQFLEDEEVYYFNSNRGLRNVLAVTAACLMVEKKKFMEAQGFADELRVAFNDVDFCFKLYELGYFNVCNNDCYAYHHESLSRGDDESLEKWKRLLQERDVLYTRHSELEGQDPYYGAGLGREGLDTRIRPAYETDGNRIQSLLGNNSSILTSDGMSAYRQDNCLLVRVENCRQGILQGYGVVLGDNNACYEKALLLEPEDDDNSVIMIPIEGQYRPDLVENMPDQTNVGLSGFWMEAKDSGDNNSADDVLKKGSYRIGMTARNRVTGLKLINWSNRIFTVE